MLPRQSMELRVPCFFLLLCYHHDCKEALNKRLPGHFRRIFNPDKKSLGRKIRPKISLLKNKGEQDHDEKTGNGMGESVWKN